MGKIVEREEYSIGDFQITTNGSGEVFLTLGETKLRISSVANDGIRIIHAYARFNGHFIPDNINGIPAMIFRGQGKKDG
jgi:hypothetical protein